MKVSDQCWISSIDFIFESHWLGNVSSCRVSNLSWFDQTWKYSSNWNYRKQLDDFSCMTANCAFTASLMIFKIFWPLKKNREQNIASCGASWNITFHQCFLNVKLDFDLIKGRNLIIGLNWLPIFVNTLTLTFSSWKFHR